MTKYKTCSKCKQTKSTTEFGTHTKTLDGLYSQCQPCRRQARAEYRKRHAETIKIEQRSNYERNREKRIAYANAKIKQNPKRHAEYMSISKKRRHLAIAADTRRRNARKKANGIYKITKKELRRLAQTPCFYCGSKKQLTVDHVIAIARGGTDSIGNLVSACKSCNSQKRDLTIMEWRKRGNPPTVYAQSGDSRSLI
jgi:5-methylcytosine-specific restriction endonuclease McrA